MMYAPYPELSEPARLGALESIDWSRCCVIAREALAEPVSIDRFELEMLAGRPVLRVRIAGSRPQLIDLTDGSTVSHVPESQAYSVAASYLRARGGTSRPSRTDVIDYDQWTVSSQFDADRPLYRFRFEDMPRTELYVSSVTAKVVQVTTARQRFWNWLGAIPHWLYFSRLRREVALWSHVVIYASLAGCLLAAAGLYVGVHQFFRRPHGRWSGYRGVKLWHHLPGLIFGVFALTWIVSGFLSMNPWGLLDSSGAEVESHRLRGGDITGADLKASLQAISAHAPAGIVSINSAPLLGRLYLVMKTGRGASQRVGSDGEPAPVTRAQLVAEARALAPAISLEGPERLSHEDRYYYSHPGDRVPLPVYRVVLRDGTRYYLDPLSGDLLEKVDRNAQRYRWLHDALHRMDFAAPLRARPLWDVTVLVLLLGVTAIAVTGAYLGLRRLARRPVS